MNLIVSYVTDPIKEVLAVFSRIFSFSLAELLVVIGVMVLLVLLILSIRGLLSGKNRGLTLYKTLCAAVCIALSIYGSLCIMFGANYYADSFQQKSGIYAKSYGVEELYDLTVYFADMANEYSDKVPRDGNGVFAVSQEEIFSQSTDIFQNLEKQYPFLERTGQIPKGLVSSPLLSYTTFTGFYFPLTSEANINTDAPDSTIPFTIAHEMAHQRDVAPEDEANFVAVLACTTSGNDVYTYSGYLYAYIYLSNALYGSDYSLWQDARSLLSDGCLADLDYINSYWSSFRTPVSEFIDKVYDSFLKSYGNKAGTDSYSEVVLLLEAYYITD